MSTLRRYICIRFLLSHGWQMLTKSVYRKGVMTVVVDSDGYIHTRR